MAGAKIYQSEHAQNFGNMVLDTKLCQATCSEHAIADVIRHDWAQQRLHNHTRGRQKSAAEYLSRLGVVVSNLK